MTMADLFPTNLILRAWITDISLLPGVISIYTYLAGIFRALPNFLLTGITGSSLRDQHTYIPSAREVMKLYWYFLIVFVTWSQVTSVLNGYYRERQNINGAALTFRLHYAIHAFMLCMTGAGLAYYGRMLVALTLESVALTGQDENPRHATGKVAPAQTGKGTNGDGEKVISRMEWHQKRLRRNIRKMQISNYGFTLICMIVSILLMVTVIGYKSAEEEPTGGRALFYAFEFGLPLLVIVVLLGILQAECYPKNAPEATDTQTTWSTTSPV